MSGVPKKEKSNGVKLIIGLGNPGPKYEKTRHNIGFRILDELAKQFELEFKPSKKYLAELTETKVGTEKIILAKPMTFMNRSGAAVAKLTTSYQLPATQLLVIHDEIDLPFGKIRVTENSGPAGHHGIESSIAAIGQNFRRLRVGIENRTAYRQPDTETYVLQNFTMEEEQQLTEVIIPQAVAEIKTLLQIK